MYSKIYKNNSESLIPDSRLSYIDFASDSIDS